MDLNIKVLNMAGQTSNCIDCLFHLTKDIMLLKN